ncbi:aminoglycoside N(3)-acetyltransferase [Iocasia frigidifontis]|uniref:Aminoglycoside N(3)-acetyltransferase n=1 Tax=Iocasia fonsfrigidae TaxID=2682810 RepID=A0A8A7KH45_9FIRM|nr:AAC(3) family N-acetyltransferase [Iocasia fonsfrigidae]QTL99078.1 aminoglycoside N(3)-acetyltransferase [Iocasia fonsfrigidae]
MYTKADIINYFSLLGINSKGTLLVHSSMKSIGDVDGGAETVIDAFVEYMKQGLLIFPTHSWGKDNLVNDIYDPLTEPSCVGILSNIFMKKTGVVRSLHPTHSIAARGKDALEYIQGEERFNTPCPRGGCWGRLYDRKAQILFLGCSLKTNTFIHSVEEWCCVPNRLANKSKRIKIINPYGNDYHVDLYGHQSTYGDVSRNYDKLRDVLLYKGIAVKGLIGDARCYLCDTVGMGDITTKFLNYDIDLFADNRPIPPNWYK